MISFARVPVWAITPGLAITTLICAVPPITASRPRIRPSTSSLSIPFWNDTTAVPGRTSGFTAVAAASVSHSFTPISTRSAGSSVDGSSVAVILVRFRSPRALRTTSPLARMAPRCAPRATNATSLPTAASRAPK